MSFRTGIRCFQSLILNRDKSQYILRTSYRCLKDKHWKKVFPNLDEKELKKTKIVLKDQNGNIMGDKLLVEAQLLAQKLKLNLIEDTDLSHHFKYKAFKLVSNQYLAEMDNESDVTQQDNNNISDSDVNHKEKNSSVSTQTVKEVKHLVFSTKLNENDLMTKINQIKRWLSRGNQISINVTNAKNDKKILEEIYTKFEKELKGFAKINQKKIKSNNTLKFMILSANDTKEKLKSGTNGDLMSDDFENLDPNKLLSDEFEKELEKK